MMDRTAQTLTLRDGRRLGFAEWGDLNGKPVFVFGGSNSARYFRHPDDSIVREMSIHLYSFDRPGQGLSTRQPRRSLLDWSKDIRDFATQNRISRFALVATSQGGPYGAAGAYALPDLITSVSLVSGVAGLEDPAVMATQNRMIRMQIGIARRAPWLLALQNDLMRPLLKGERAKMLIDSLLGHLPDSDKQVMSAPDVVNLMIADIREGMRQGGAGGADDMHAVVTDWGFRLEDIRTKVYIWQGEDDPNVTPAMAHYMVARIPNSKAVIVPGAGHLLIVSHWQKILQQMLDYWTD